MPSHAEAGIAAPAAGTALPASHPLTHRHVLAALGGGAFGGIEIRLNLRAANDVGLDRLAALDALDRKSVV